VPRVLHHGPPAPVPPPLRVAPADSAGGVGGAGSRAPLVVDVAGAVRRPGLYHLARGTRIADAIALAGGVTRRADRNAVNLAAPLDLNTATLEQLDALPGIGPTTAQKILDYRQAHGPFHSVAELDGVPGIGQGRLEQLKGLVIP
jgi:competence protein ComEA